MIYRNNKEITFIYKGTKPISMLYRGEYLLWQAVRSCFGMGYWINDKAWLNDEGWKN